MKKGMGRQGRTWGYKWICQQRRAWWLPRDWQSKQRGHAPCLSPQASRQTQEGLGELEIASLRVCADLCGGTQVMEQSRSIPQAWQPSSLSNYPVVVFRGGLSLSLPSPAPGPRSSNYEGKVKSSLTGKINNANYYGITVAWWSALILKTNTWCKTSGNRPPAHDD